jgi:hypothetical protein
VLYAFVTTRTVIGRLFRSTDRFFHNRNLRFERFGRDNGQPHFTRSGKLTRLAV